MDPDKGCHFIFIDAYLVIILTLLCFFISTYYCRCTIFPLSFAGDKYLKPIVISDPEVNMTERSPDDECLILASDGLWDVLSNDMACDVARQCLREGSPSSSTTGEVVVGPDEATDKAMQASQSRCSVAAALLTRLALGRNSADNISVIVIDLKRG